MFGTVSQRTAQLRGSARVMLYCMRFAILVGEELVGVPVTLQIALWIFVFPDNQIAMAVPIVKLK